MVYEAREKIFYRPLDRTINLKFLRTIAKTVVHASNYGMGPMMLQTVLILQEVWLEFATCKQLLADASAARPLKAQWQKNTIEEVRLKRVLYNCFGDKREFRGRLSPGLFNSALAFRPQSTVGRILQFAIQDIDDTVPEYESLLNVHDEVVGQCDESAIPSLIPCLRNCLVREHEVNGRLLSIPCDFKEGPSWGEMKEIPGA
jgi:DNA polymerase I-like protein with 3'-5' exonuclease and polymerase domains